MRRRDRPGSKQSSSGANRARSVSLSLLCSARGSEEVDGQVSLVLLGCPYRCRTWRGTLKPTHGTLTLSRHLCRSSARPHLSLSLPVGSRRRLLPPHSQHVEHCPTLSWNVDSFRTSFLECLVTPRLSTFLYFTVHRCLRTKIIDGANHSPSEFAKTKLPVRI